MSGGKVVACPRCGSCDPLDTQMQIDYWRGFKFCVMACVCGYGEAAPYCGDFENVSARFYRKEATDLAAAIARAEAAERDAERYRFCVDHAAWPVIANDGETWVMFVVVKGRRRSTFMAATATEAIDAAIAAQQAEGEA